MEENMKLKPLDDRVVIEVKEELAEKNVGGIIIPDTAKEKPQIGKIIAVGTEEELKELVKVGDEILYSKYGGTEIDIEDKKYLIVSRSDILAIIK
jgi:chaperonin GroES